MDYRETFALDKMVTARRLLLIAIGRHWSLHQLDDQNFSLGDIDEEMYVLPPPGYTQQGEKYMCRLKQISRLIKASISKLVSKLSMTFWKLGLTIHEEYSLSFRLQDRK